MGAESHTGERGYNGQPALLRELDAARPCLRFLAADQTWNRLRRRIGDLRWPCRVLLHAERDGLTAARAEAEQQIRQATGFLLAEFRWLDVPLADAEAWIADYRARVARAESLDA